MCSVRSVGGVSQPEVCVLWEVILNQKSEFRGRLQFLDAEASDVAEKHLPQNARKAQNLLAEKYLPQIARKAQNLLAEKYLPQIGTDAHRTFWLRSGSHR